MALSNDIVYSFDDERSPMAMERRMRIVETLNGRGSITISEITELLGASLATVRRDLTWLDQRGMLTRTRGGAIAKAQMQQFLGTHEPTQHLRQQEQIAEKQAIGCLAASMINDGETLIIDTGSSTLALIPFLAAKKDLLVITTSLSIVNAIVQLNHSCIRVLLTGGTLRSQSLSMVGALAEHVLSQYFVDKTFLGVRGVSIEHGFTDPSIDDLAAKRLMVKAARDVIVLADHTKFGRIYTSRIASIDAAHTIVSDAGAPEQSVHDLAAQGPRVLLAPLDAASF